MNENNIQIEQQSGIEQQSEAQAKRLLAYYSYLRKSQKMTQSELERITGLSRIAINRCENGKLMPTIRSMNKHLDISLALCRLMNQTVGIIMKK